MEGRGEAQGRRKGGHEEVASGAGVGTRGGARNTGVTRGDVGYTYMIV
jgi:hypothetical protein